MATYNGGKFIREQLESILSQLPPDAEIIVADDGSTDDTLAVVESLGDARIRVLPAETHLGAIYNFERALKVSRGEVVFLADQDDVWLPGKVQKVSESLKEFDLVHHDAFMLAQVAEPATWQRGRLLSEIRPYKLGVFRNWLVNGYNGNCMAFRRSVLEKALPFPKKLPMHDQWIGLVGERFFKVGYIAEPLVEYRQHSGTATHIGNSQAGILQKIKWRLDLARVLVCSSNV
jgi:glycosyltransferase involved in cell wall biosynthesis